MENRAGVILVFFLWPLFFSTSATAEIGIEVRSLVWEYPTKNELGNPLQDPILGTFVYCESNDGGYSTVKNIPAPDTSLDLNTLALPDGNYSCAITVYVQLAPNADFVESKRSLPVGFFAAAGTLYSVDPRSKTPEAPINVRLE